MTGRRLLLEISLYVTPWDQWLCFCRMDQQLHIVICIEDDMS